jgi:hypothetical protein
MLRDDFGPGGIGLRLKLDDCYCNIRARWREKSGLAQELGAEAFGRPFEDKGLVLLTPVALVQMIVATS